MKHGKGCLIKRGNSYSVRIVIDGKIIVRALKNPDNTPCQTAQEARRAQAIATLAFTMGDRREALQATIRQLADTQAEIDKLQHPKAKIQTLWQAYVANGERPDSGEGCMQNYERHTRQFVEWIGKNFPRIADLEDITKGVATDYSRHLTDTYSNVTHNKNIAFLRLLFKVLTEDKPNPFDRIRLKPKDTTEHQPLTQTQLQTVLNKAEGELNSFLLVGIYTSLRRKDACLLKWSQVDMEKGLITVTPSKTASRSHKVVCIPIHPILKARLETIFRKSEYVLPRMAFWYEHNPAHISRRIKDLFEACGIKTQFEITNKAGSRRNNKAILSFHSLRFTMGQMLISNGFSLDAISQILGHSNIAQSRHYSTITDSVKEKAIMSLPSILQAETQTA